MFCHITDFLIHQLTLFVFGQHSHPFDYLIPRKSIIDERSHYRNLKQIGCEHALNVATLTHLLLNLSAYKAEIQVVA
jgi:hypothetical protein